MTLDPEKLKKMVRDIATTSPQEIGCEECFEQVDRYVDLKLAGKDAAAAMPLVETHLAHCKNCFEEYRALLIALQRMA
jgi:hypothetical protein